MAVNLNLIKKLRELTSASINDCRKALEEAEEDLDKAIHILRQRGLEIAQEKKDRAVREGRIESYVHLGNKIGVLVEINCETDFVARNEEFIRFSKDVAMQIAAQAPLYINKEDIPTVELEKHKDDLQDYLKNVCLLEQPFIKNPAITIRDYLAELIAKIRENIVIRRFTRYRLGE
ncbi:MAG: translation elongation factor Ts [Candidatus Omnitrophica bacterium]|nr:translation elongation factor Ts [Candidatus Omnitrophota bacterium]